MPMLTVHVDAAAPTVTQFGEYTTLSWGREVRVQMNREEWQALLDAVAGCRR